MRTSQITLLLAVGAVGVGLLGGSAVNAFPEVASPIRAVTTLSISIAFACMGLLAVARREVPFIFPVRGPIAVAIGILIVLAWGGIALWAIVRLAMG